MTSESANARREQGSSEQVCGGFAAFTRSISSGMSRGTQVRFFSVPSANRVSEWQTRPRIANTVGPADSTSGKSPAPTSSASVVRMVGTSEQRGRPARSERRLVGARVDQNCLH